MSESRARRDAKDREKGSKRLEKRFANGKKMSVMLRTNYNKDVMRLLDAVGLTP